MGRRIIILVVAGLLGLATMAGPATAAHVHGKVLPNGKCVLLAPAGGEKDVQLPGTNDDYPANRRHPLHVKVHLGVPGTQAQPGTIFVALNDDGSLTDDAVERCGGQFLNRP